MKTIAVALLLLGSTLAQSQDLNGIANLISRQDRQIVDAFDECAHNSSSSIGTFDVKKFDAKQIAKEIREYDKNRYCSKRTYSFSKENAVELFEKVTKTASFDVFSEDATACVKEINKYTKDNLDNIMKSDKSLAIFSSVMRSDEDSSESCAYYDFYIFKSDGTMMFLTFEYTD